MNNSYPTISHFFFPFFYISNYSQEKDWWISHSIIPTIIPPSLDQLIIHQRARNDPISRHGSNILSMECRIKIYILLVAERYNTLLQHADNRRKEESGFPDPWISSSDARKACTQCTRFRIEAHCFTLNQLHGWAPVRSYLSASAHRGVSLRSASRAKNRVCVSTYTKWVYK